MIRLTETRTPQPHSPHAKDLIELHRLKDLQRRHCLPSHSPKLKNKSKSRSNCKGQSHNSKDSYHQGENSHRPQGKHSLFIYGGKKQPVSQDKAEKVTNKKDRFRRKNAQSSSRKDSKRSTDNQNEETLIQRLKAQNEYYKQALLQERESLERVQKSLQQERKRGKNEKQWFKYQLEILRKQIKSDKLNLRYLSPSHPIGTTITQTDNEGSSLLQTRPEDTPDNQQALSSLSIDSK